MPTLTSAAGTLAMLKEDHPSLKIHALANLDRIVDEFWPEICASTDCIKSLVENGELGEEQRKLAALVLSKVFYYLGKLDDALSYANEADLLFDVSEGTLFVHALITHAIQRYSSHRDPKFASIVQSDEDPDFASIIKRSIDNSVARGSYKEALGVALDCRRLDIMEEIAAVYDGSLPYLNDACESFVEDREYRLEVLHLLVKLYHKLPLVDYFSLCHCLILLDDPLGVVSEIRKLLCSENDQHPLIGFQIAFEIVEMDNLDFIQQVINGVSLPALNGIFPAHVKLDDYGKHLPKVLDILSGRVSTELTLRFLWSYYNSSDELTMETIMKYSGMSSVCSTAAASANALMYAGTSRNKLHEEYKGWLARATNWAEFSIIAGLGVIFRGQLEYGRSLMAPFLPQGGILGRHIPFTEGGALYALGLIHGNRDLGIKKFLRDNLRSTTVEVIQHGACLGLGLSALGSADEAVYDEIKQVLNSDSAVSGEAAGISMGLVMVGTATQKADEMLAYAREAQHEKTIRGLALGIALTMYGREEEADSLIEHMTEDRDPILRYGGVYALAMAYQGTSSQKAIRKLLHFCVSDVSDDVRRAAVLALGFVLYSDPEQVPQIVSLLSQSYNPHVRYGAALAVGISCAGTGLSEAISLLDPLTWDGIEFVRQGALIAMAMVMMQKTEATDSQVHAFRLQLKKTIMDKNEATMCKMGAILAFGILDAGGGNLTIRLVSPETHNKVSAVLGMAVFSHFWFWHPLVHFLCLALSPTALIGLDAKLQQATVLPSHESYSFEESRYSPLKRASSGFILFTDRSPAEPKAAALPVLNFEDEMIAAPEPESIYARILVFRHSQLKTSLQHVNWGLISGGFGNVEVDHVNNEEEAYSCISTFRYHLVLLPFGLMGKHELKSVVLGWRQLGFKGLIVVASRKEIDDLNLWPGVDCGLLLETSADEFLLNMASLIEDARVRWH